MKIFAEIFRHPALTVMTIILGLIYLFFFCYAPPLISPDEFSYKFFSHQLARENTIFYRPAGDRIMGEKGFLPRKFHYNVKDDVVPRKPPGLMIVWAGFEKLVGTKFSATIFPLLALLVLFLFYRLTGDIFSDRRLRLASMLLLASMPVFLLRSHAYSPTMLNLAVFLALLILMGRLLDNGRWYYYTGAGLLMGLLLWIRPTSLLIWVPVLLAIFLERKKVRRNGLIWLAGTALVVVGFYLTYNKLVFGNFLATGYSIHNIETGERIAAVKGFFEIVKFHPRIWLTHIVSAPISFSLAFPPLIIGVIGYFMMLKEKIARRWLYFAALLGAVLLLFFSNFGTYGYASREMTLRSSFFRYCLPALIFLVPPVIFLLNRLKYFFQRALAILIAFNIVVALFAPLGLIESALLGDYYRQAREFILENTDEDTVIFSAYWD
ncbi:MAG: glycosyltransferase family 39 protein, partial [Candidatus Auribacterota bacterium]|nr:glycosyltransferase family 39 protein [Candidatus Auribacterota bacterium]